MMRTRLSSSGNATELIPAPPMLMSESIEEFARLKRAFEDEIRPKDVIEKVLVADFVAVVWEMLRLRRCKAIIINVAHRSALSDLLRHRLQVLEDPEAEALANRYFTEAAAKREVLQILKKYGLDESAIEAEAVRNCLRDLELIDGMLLLQETRRSKTLRIIGEYRDALAQRVKASSERIVQATPSRWLVDSSKEKPAA